MWTTSALGNANITMIGTDPENHPEHAWKVVDVQFKGIWLAITQQQDFVSTIDNAGGNIDVLINQLQKGGSGRR